MRILFCAQEAPLPPPDGFRLYLNSLASQLIEEHDVRILAFQASTQDPDASTPFDMRLLQLPPRRSPEWFGYIAGSLLRSVFLSRPLRVDEYARRLEAPLREELASFRPDVVHVATGSLAAVADALDGVPSVLAALDAWHLNVEAWAAEARGVRKWILNSEAGRVRRFEAREFRRFGRVLVVTDEDKKALQSLDPNLRVSVIPNGVDVGRYMSRGRDRVGARIVFTGVMSYAPNVAAAELLARRIMPEVRASLPKAHLQIVGRQPNAKVRQLGELDAVEVTGEVPDVEPYLSSSSVYACPMVSGTGIKNKLLEAMANGLACVATPLAVQGMAVTNGIELELAEPKDFAPRLVAVLRDGQRAARLGSAAQAYALDNHSWAAVAARHLEAYGEVISDGGAGLVQNN
ncbi:MAG: glycosyltransferase family 4 protein [Actinomycetota bacterium]|nr:glycosyltransferase family 4 protein [Actinomycetota bacterium]